LEQGKNNSGIKKGSRISARRPKERQPKANQLKWREAGREKNRR